ncbi:MAG: hypothetical protein ACYC75_03205 [Minisyncoccota bacterium]
MHPVIPRPLAAGLLIDDIKETDSNLYIRSIQFNNVKKEGVYMKGKLKPEEFEVSGGMKSGHIKWISGLKLLKKFGLDTEKCEIAVDNGHLSVQHNGSVVYTCGPKLWRKVSPS